MICEGVHSCVLRSVCQKFLPSVTRRRAPLRPSAASKGRNEAEGVQASAPSNRIEDRGVESIVPDTSGAAAIQRPQDTKPSLLERIKLFFTGGALDRKRLVALGMGAMAAYGVISNATYGTCFSIAWLAHVKQTGLTPLAPGQWQGFLAIYAGMWVMQNFARPFRFSLAVALAPVFDKALERIASRLSIKKGWAFGIVLLLIGVCTTSIMGGALWLLGGFPGGFPTLRG